LLFAAPDSQLAAKTIWQAKTVLEKGGKPGEKGPQRGSFSLPFRPLFGMVFHLSLGVHRGSPKHKPKLEKPTFSAASGAGKRIS
jgi:hypothetical protein